MREFWIRAAGVFLMAVTLLGYNAVIGIRDRDARIEQLSVQAEGMESTGGQSAGAGDYKDGTYTGEADGFGGKIAVEVKIDGGKIQAINILSAEKEDGAYLAMAEDIIPEMINAQSAEVDTVGGATFSSGGIRDAAVCALEKAVK